MRGTRVTGAGFGCPVILFVDATPDLLKRYAALPQNGIHLPATAVARLWQVRAPRRPADGGIVAH